MTSHGVARDQLIAFVERVERIEADIKELNSDKSDVYAEAKSLGFDVKVLKKVVAKRRMDSAERDEQDAIFDMYWDTIHGYGLVHARVRENVEEFDAETGEVFGTRSPRKAAEAVSDRTAINPEAKASVDNAAISAPETAPAGREMRVGSEPSGSVPATSEGGRDSVERHAPNQPETANEMDREEMRDGKAVHSMAAEKGRKAIPDGPEGVDLNHAGAGESPATPIAPASHGEAEGAVIRFELCPSRPMKRLPFVHCFPDLTKTEYERLSISISENGVEDPIIRDGDTIVDGWNRYNIARSLGMEYPVKQFEGGDVLSFVIAAQRASRGWSQSQERKIAAALCKELPHRAIDINAAFHVEEEFA